MSVKSPEGVTGSAYSILFKLREFLFEKIKHSQILNWVDGHPSGSSRDLSHCIDNLTHSFALYIRQVMTWYTIFTLHIQISKSKKTNQNTIWRTFTQCPSKWLAYRTSNKIEHLLNKPCLYQDRNDGTKFNDSGIYKLNRSYCDKIYVGKTQFQRTYTEKQTWPTKLTFPRPPYNS